MKKVFSSLAGFSLLFALCLMTNLLSAQSGNADYETITASNTIAKNVNVTPSRKRVNVRPSHDMQEAPADEVISAASMTTNNDLYFDGENWGYDANGALVTMTLPTVVQGESYYFSTEDLAKTEFADLHSFLSANENVLVGELIEDKQRLSFEAKVTDEDWEAIDLQVLTLQFFEEVNSHGDIIYVNDWETNTEQGSFVVQSGYVNYIQKNWAVDTGIKQIFFDGEGWSMNEETDVLTMNIEEKKLHLMTDWLNGDVVQAMNGYLQADQQINSVYWKAPKIELKIAGNSNTLLRVKIKQFFDDFVGDDFRLIPAQLPLLNTIVNTTNFKLAHVDTLHLAHYFNGNNWNDDPNSAHLSLQQNGNNYVFYTEFLELGLVRHIFDNLRKDARFRLSNDLTRKGKVIKFTILSKETLPALKQRIQSLLTGN